MNTVGTGTVESYIEILRKNLLEFLKYYDNIRNYGGTGTYRLMEIIVRKSHASVPSNLFIFFAFTFLLAAFCFSVNTVSRYPYPTFLRPTNTTTTAS